MNQKKPTLGRGLADLLGQARPHPVTSSGGVAAGTEMPGAPALRPGCSERTWSPRSAALIRSGS